MYIVYNFYNRHPHTYWEQNIHSPLTIVEALEFKNQIEDDVTNNFMNQISASGNLKCQMLKSVLDDETQEYPLVNIDNQHIPTTVVRNSIPIEIELGKVLNINGIMGSDQKKKLIKVLQKY